MWWGKGFTEWTNVTKAKPRFVGHYQPHLPADLGFYDLHYMRLEKLRRIWQKNMVFLVFATYRYWFNGKRMLYEPLDRKLAIRLRIFRLCLLANENWSRAWDGSEQQILRNRNISKMMTESMFSI